MNKIIYQKKALTISQQIKQLESRGLQIDDKDLANKTLSSINYYRLSGYWMFYEISREPHRFKNNTTFQDILYMYNFDKDLRSYIFEGISRFEVSLRTAWAYETGLRYGPQAFFEKRLNKNISVLNNNIEQSKKEVARSKEVFIKHNTSKYSGELPAIWVFCEVISFGNLSCWYTNLKEVASINPQFPGNAKDAISARYLIDSKLLISWLHCIVVLRNFCAHQARLVNRILTIVPKKPKSKKNIMCNCWNSDNTKLYDLIMILVYLNIQIKIPTTWGTSFKNFLITNKDACKKFLGFPDNWELNDFWTSF